MILRKKKLFKLMDQAYTLGVKDGLFAAELKKCSHEAIQQIQQRSEAVPGSPTEAAIQQEFDQQYQGMMCNYYNSKN